MWMGSWFKGGVQVRPLSFVRRKETHAFATGLLAQPELSAQTTKMAVPLVAMAAWSEVLPLTLLLSLEMFAGVLHVIPSSVELENQISFSRWKTA